MVFIRFLLKQQRNHIIVHPNLHSDHLFLVVGKSHVIYLFIYRVEMHFSKMQSHFGHKQQRLLFFLFFLYIELAYHNVVPLIRAIPTGVAIKGVICITAKMTPKP